MRIALYQPDIPQNTGTLIRTGACLGVPVDIIEPCGFPFSTKASGALKRSSMDYMDHADIRRHDCWEAFEAWRQEAAMPLILLTTSADAPYTSHRFEKNTIIMVGRESAGVPENVSNAADSKIRIPMQAGLRSLNVAVAAAMVLGEALRQTQE